MDSLNPVLLREQRPSRRTTTSRSKCRWPVMISHGRRRNRSAAIRSPMPVWTVSLGFPWSLDALQARSRDPVAVGDAPGRIGILCQQPNPPAGARSGRQHL